MSVATLREAADGATTQSSEAIGALLARLTQDIEKSAAALNLVANEATSQSSQAMGAQIDRFTQDIEKSTQVLRMTADAAAADTSETIGGLIGRLTEDLERSSASLREAVEFSAQSSLGSLASTGDRLRQELSTVLDRLGQAGTALDRVVGSAGSKLGEIEEVLSIRVEDLQRSLGAIASQVSELDRMTVATKEDSSAMVERMAEQTEALSDVARDLAAKQHTIDLALQHRQTSLQNLFVEIGAKTAEFDAMMRRFTGSVEESFAKAQARAQEISTALAATTKGTATTVAGQFELIRENAGRERERTEQALQAAYDQASAQLSQLMEQAAEKFRLSVAEVKQMAGEMQRELDETRRELRRGVFELPQETNEAANAMRRVVSDQIKALKELAAVVSSAGADFDVAEPAPAPPTAPSLPAAPVAHAEPTPPPSPSPSPDEDAIRMIAAPVRSYAPGPVEPLRTRAPAPPPPYEPALASDRNKAGWLSNLLAAASRDEQEPPARSDSLESISSDIARYVDTDAAVEMWERWRSGEVGAVSRRLYTVAGQQAFDDVRRRYRADAAFRDSVSRYIQEFERLLAKIGQNDRDGAQSRLAMLSDSGKVYIMLAHASGRLG